MELKFGKVGGLWVWVLAADSSQPLGEMKLLITVSLVYFDLCCIQLSFQAKYSKNDVTKFGVFFTRENINETGICF